MLAAKPFASLSSGLLARKGQARPAMRRQMTVAGDDLGWNDMGEPLPEAEASRPPVLTMRADLAESLDAEIEDAAETGQDTPKPRRTAFTLRLDADRHLRLRLASATRRVSAQKLMTQALDQFLKTVPELEPLAARALGAN